MSGHLEDCMLPLSLHSALTSRQWGGSRAEGMRKYPSPAGYSSSHPAIIAGRWMTQQEKGLAS